MRAGLHWDGVLAQRVTQLQREWEHTGNSPSGKSDRNGHLRAEDRDRILRVLRTIDAAPLPAGA